MKEYMKMSDVFYAACNAPVAMDDELYCGDHFIAEFCSRRMAVNAAHAINSHDELVAMNKDLLAALEMVWKSAEHAYDGASGSYLMFDDERDIVNSAIAKAKGIAV